MSRFLQYMDEKCDGSGAGSKDGTGMKKKKRKGKKDMPMEEDYTAGKGIKDKEAFGLVQVLVGWPKDIQRMIGYENYDGALQSLKTFKTKVIPDLEKALKKLKMKK